MAKYNYNLLQLDVDKLFEEHNISEIIEIERLLDTEIEKKRNELRGMVGDRYKDILTASDAIKSMKSTSESIVENIKKITAGCMQLTIDTQVCESKRPPADPPKIEERTIIIQIRLAFVMNNQIWLTLDEEDFSTAAQFYLLAQHIHIGLQLVRKEILMRLPILKRMKSDIDALQERILKRVKEKLQDVELDVQVTSSNLNALMLLENQSSSQLLITFMELRKTALKLVINQGQTSVRAQTTAMVRCLISTVHILHDCFINYEKNESGLIWQQLQKIVGEDETATLYKVKLPDTRLIAYIPDIIKDFKPKCSNLNVEPTQEDIETIIQNWLTVTEESIKAGLENSLELVTNLRGLHMIQEEALKIELPKNWGQICSGTNLPGEFNVWYYFFQKLVTTRAERIISKKVSSAGDYLKSEIVQSLNNATEAASSENDFRWCIWNEEAGDVSRVENRHSGVSMKTKGYSPCIVNLCEKLDNKYLELLQDITFYLYGAEYEGTLKKFTYPLVNNKNYTDRVHLENHLRSECSNHSYKLAEFLEHSVISEIDTNIFVIKSLTCARFLQALTTLCPNYNKCCSCNGQSNQWEKICGNFDRCSLQFWKNWVDSSSRRTTASAIKLLGNIDTLSVLAMLPKWDTIEIQEQTEEKTFKSQIKVPAQPSLVLQRLLAELSNDMNAAIPHTLPKQIHLLFVEKNIDAIIKQYENLANNQLNQTQALQFLFDIKLLTTLSIPRENVALLQISQEICDKLRGKIDPFDLDVFYSYLQNNVKSCVLQSQVILGCLLPHSGQLASLGMSEKGKQHEKEPSVLAVCVPTTSSWFPLLPVTAPVQKIVAASQPQHKDTKAFGIKMNKPAKKPTSEATNPVRSGAAAIFGAMTNDWFS